MHLAASAAEKNRTRCEICPQLTIKTLELRNSLRPSVFIVTFEHITFFFWYLQVVIFVYSSLVWYRQKLSGKKRTSVFCENNCNLQKHIFFR